MSAHYTPVRLTGGGWLHSGESCGSDPELPGGDPQPEPVVPPSESGAELKFLNQRVVFSRLDQAVTGDTGDFRDMSRTLSRIRHRGC